MEEQKQQADGEGGLKMGQEYLMEIIKNLDTEEFRMLANRLLEKMEFTITDSRVRADDVEIEAMREIDGITIPFIIRLKRGNKDTGPEEIQKMVGRKKGGVDMRVIFISTAFFTKDAYKYADLLGVSIADGEKFGLLLKEMELDRELKKQETRKVIQQDGERFLPSIDELENQMTWGNDFFNSGNYKKAIEYYDNALKMKPNYDIAWIMKGNVLSAMERFEEAAGCFKKALEVNPDSEESWYNLGAIYYNLQKFDEEIQCYDRALDINPNFTKAWNNKGATLHEQGKFEEAVLCYDRVLYLEPKHVNVLNNKGVALKHLKDYGGALDSFDKAIDEKDDYKDAWLNKALLLHEMERYEDAILCYDRVLGIEKSPEIYYQKGIALAAMEQYRKAIDTFNSSLVLKPAWTLAADEKEKAEAALKDMDETRLKEEEEKRVREEEERLAREKELKAQEEEKARAEEEEKEKLAKAEEEEKERLAREAEKASPKPKTDEKALTDDFADIMMGDEAPLVPGSCAKCSADLNDNAKFCFNCGEEVILPEPETVKPGEVGMFFCSECGAEVDEDVDECGECGAYLADEEEEDILPEPELPAGEPPELEAIEEKEALEMELDEEARAFEKGKLLVSLMRYDEALDCMNEALEVEERPGLRLEKANLLFLMGRFDDAIEDYNTILKKEPDNTSALMNKASALIEIKDYDEALKVNDKLLELEDAEPILWIERGNILLSLGDIQKAVESFDRAIELAPEMAEVWNAEGAALLETGKHDDAVLCFDRAIQIDPDFAEAWCNKGNA
ncbi:MAG: tetratricopeptide repeat protein, partial [Thermoplasmata archaeon]|nr:tetratricopeptide repeat protein [Thermoplasmata archaeon]